MRNARITFQIITIQNQNRKVVNPKLKIQNRTMARLELINLNKTYNPKVVPVRDVSLTVDDNEFLTLLGPSGCGKSTTLRMIAGLEEPTRGKIFLGSEDITFKRPGDRNMAMVFQSYALYPHMSVYENMASGLKLKKSRVVKSNSKLQKSHDF